MLALQCMKKSSTHLDKLGRDLMQCIATSRVILGKANKSETQDLCACILTEEACQLEKSLLMRHVLIGLQHNIIDSLWIQVKETNQGFHFLDLHSAKATVRSRRLTSLQSSQMLVWHSAFPDMHIPYK